MSRLIHQPRRRHSSSSFIGGLHRDDESIFEGRSRRALRCPSRQPAATLGHAPIRAPPRQAGACQAVGKAPGARCSVGILSALIGIKGTAGWNQRYLIPPKPSSAACCVGPAGAGSALRAGRQQAGEGQGGSLATRPRGRGGAAALHGRRLTRLAHPAKWYFPNRKRGTKCMPRQSGPCRTTSHFGFCLPPRNAKTRTGDSTPPVGARHNATGSIRRGDPAPTCFQLPTAYCLLPTAHYLLLLPLAAQAGRAFEQRKVQQRPRKDSHQQDNQLVTPSGHDEQFSLLETI